MADVRGTCRSCGAPIVWVVILKADGSTSRMPLDADPDRRGKALEAANGNLELVGRNDVGPQAQDVLELLALCVAMAGQDRSAVGGNMRKAGQQKLKIVPMTLKEANAFVDEHHRHHGPSVGHKFSIGVKDEDGKVRGAAIAGRPVARGSDNGARLEVTRLATDGCQNACSALYAAVRRIAKEMGFDFVGTYILASEPGTSLKASGWVQKYNVRGRSWSCKSRPREDDHPLEDKVYWEVAL